MLPFIITVTIQLGWEESKIPEKSFVFSIVNQISDLLGFEERLKIRIFF